MSDIVPAKKRVKFPISFKLILIISVLLIVALGITTVLVSITVSQDVQVTAEDNNYTINKRSATEAESLLVSIRSNVFLFLDMLTSGAQTAVRTKQTSSLFFERNQDIAAIVIPGNQTYINNRFFVSNELDTNLVNSFVAQEKENIARSVRGEVLVLNAAPLFDLPVLALLYPWQEGGKEEAVVILFSSDAITDSFGTGANSTIMVNHDGAVLVSADFDLVKAGANLGKTAVVEKMRASAEKNQQVLYTDADGVEYFGAFYKLSMGDTAVITSVPSGVIFEGIIATTRRNVYLSVAVLFASILFVWFFSKSISKPVKVLTHAAQQIEAGQFVLDIKAKTHDELGLLTDSFVQMGKGLAERERLKDTFGRFINKEIAEQAMKGELRLGGETKYVTIFFSDIRSFTAISEKMEPFEVVSFLNEYMTRMVNCVNVTHGVVDKFIGDAVMAIWGAPLSAGSPAEDALNCIRSALMMRASLIEFNVGRGGDKKPIIKIGCGINTGPVVAGQIGSNERMEYTVIGDAVNFASRTESLNKPMGTDILITENTYELVKDHIIAHEMPSVTVKGKEKPVKMFAVVNMPNVVDIPGAGKDGPQTLREVRELLGIPTPDFEEVDLDADEKKYKIQGQ